MDLIVGFSKRQGLGSWVIRSFEGTDFSHVYLRFEIKKWQTSLIYHAVGGGVGYMGQSKFLECNDVVREIRISIADSERDVLLKWCAENAGATYSYAQLVRLAWRRICLKLGVAKPRTVQDPANFVCSELVGRTLQIVGFSFLQDPEDLGLREVAAIVAQIGPKD